MPYNNNRVKNYKYYVLLTFKDGIGHTVAELTTNNLQEAHTWAKMRTEDIKESTVARYFRNDGPLSPGLDDELHELERQDIPYCRYTPRQRVALDGKSWWLPYDKLEHKWSPLTCHGKYKTKKACQAAITSYHEEGWY